MANGISVEKNCVEKHNYATDILYEWRINLTFAA